MVTSEEIIERSMYASLMRVALNLGVTINPEDYFPITPDNQTKYKEAEQSMEPFVRIFGVGNSQSRGMKVVPRITIELSGYYPGDIGTESIRVIREDGEEDYESLHYPFTTKSAQYDIHLVAGNVKDMRLLHKIMYKALPAMGYVRPFIEETLGDYLKNMEDQPIWKDGNLFLTIGNFYDPNDNDHGILEKVYTYNVQDAMIEEEIIKNHTIVPIKDISILLKPQDNAQSVTLHVTEKD